MNKIHEARCGFGGLPDIEIDDDAVAEFSKQNKEFRMTHVSDKDVTDKMLDLTNKAIDLGQKFIMSFEPTGKLLADVENAAKTMGVSVRIMKQDGKGLRGTMDHRTDRINVAVEGDKVVSADVG